MKHSLIMLSLLASTVAFAQTSQEQQQQKNGVVAGSNATSNSVSQGGTVSGVSSTSSGGSVSGVSSTSSGGAATVNGNTLQGGTAAVSGNTLQAGSAAVNGNTLQGGAAAGGAVSGVTASNGLTVGCLVNCADTSQGSKDAADAQVQAALINAAAARDIAALNGQTSRDVAATTQTLKNTPSVSGPPLVSSNDTCMGSSSGSLNVPGIGVSVGSTWTDGNCRMLKNSRELWNMGMKAAAMALMCTDKDNREALELTGFECPTRKKEAQKVSVAPADQYTDPIVRQRLGLKPLEAQ